MESIPLNSPTNTAKRDYLLMVISGIMLGISFPPNPAGTLAFFSFLPFLLVLNRTEDYNTTLKYSYIMAFAINLISIYWVGGFTHTRDIYLMFAGGLLLFANPVFFFIPVLAYHFIRRQLSESIALLSFPFIWVTFEYFRAHTEFSFPWLNIGYTQSYNLPFIQCASITGVYGVSFIILCINILGVFLFQNIARKKWNILSKQSGVAVLGIVLLYAVPKIYGMNVLEHHPENEKPQQPIRVAIVQPNIDPWEKWENSIDHQLDVLEKMSNEVVPFTPDLIVWPETAVPMYILHPNNQLYFNQIKAKVDSENIPLFTGIPDVIYYPDSPAGSKIISASGEHYDTFNSSMLLRPHSDEVQKYAKMILVPFAERIPYAQTLTFLNSFEWGVGISGWGKGTDSTMFHFTSRTGNEIHFSAMICYESVFPHLAAEFSNKGAEFFTLITNDSWWGNTSGVYQHARYGIFRAIENHKWLIRCANSGISCFIDPYGRTYEETEFNTRQVILKEISLSNEKTFYTRHNDWFALWCVMLSSLMLSIAFVIKIFGPGKKI